MNGNLACIPRDWDWYEAYKSRMGAEALGCYIDRVYTFMRNMQPGSFFRLEGNVKPENIDLFVKVCCLFISEYPYLHCYFNADATQLRRSRSFTPTKGLYEKNKQITKQ
jgi:hypothetical protein